MIDFRYHLVSLISVFLALAVGIALGAGPLKETIGDTLTGQVEQLRTEKDELRGELDRTSGELQEARGFIDASGERLLAGSLSGRRVAVLALGAVDESVRTAVDERLTQSGAEVTAHATLTDAWYDPDVRSFRNQLAGLLAENLDPAPAADATLDERLAQTLVQGLAGADPAAPDALSADAQNILAILTGGDNPLVSLQEDVTTGADALVVLAVPVSESAQEEAATPSPEAGAAVLEAQLAVLSAAQQLSEGAVLADGPRVEGSLVQAVLGDDALAGALTTVSDVQLASAQITVPLALAARIGDVNGHYGSGDGETLVPDAVELTPVDRTPVVVEEQDDTSGDEGDAPDPDSTTGTQG
ncbi:copper transporter [Cellulomonas gilvus]|uniref:Copper transport outer membrane protein MctB n=1 Tax=Cellulomonas gilvus (strain ATCC 13127 / NRRL B-14078) TaxID=593907 RepID=F8A7N5_CELGA|nr:copper transporter [Cellulomonas gilvus]AEI12437.1 hypothetical protein Celgi_1935 [Cellulomonas gilvus ATCC 13127]